MRHWSLLKRDGMDLACRVRIDRRECWNSNVDYFLANGDGGLLEGGSFLGSEVVTIDELWNGLIVEVVTVEISNSLTSKVVSLEFWNGLFVVIVVTIVVLLVTTFVLAATSLLLKTYIIGCI